MKNRCRALAAAGLADPPLDEVTIEQDEAERDAFFATLGEGAPD